MALCVKFVRAIPYMMRLQESVYVLKDQELSSTVMMEYCSEIFSVRFVQKINTQAQMTGLFGNAENALTLQ